MLRVVLATQLVLALITALVVTIAYQRIDGRIEAGEEIPHQVSKKKHTGPKAPLNILVMGIDERDCEGCGIDSEGGAGGSDVSILLHVSADRRSAYGVSLPRDAMVARPDCESPDGTAAGADPALFNTAYAVGGPLCAVQTVESLTGLYIDHYLVLEFGGFVDMVDAVGGVTVCLPKAVNDPEHNIFLDAGTQELDGRDSLNYVRERSQLSVTGDIGRMKRQQAFIASLLNRVLSAGTLAQPTRVYDFLTAVADSIRVDEDLDSLRKLTDMALEFRHTDLGEIRFVTVPFEAYPADANRLQWAPEADRLWKRIAADEPLGRDFSEDSISAADPPDGTPDAGDPSGSPSPGGKSPGPGQPDEETRRAQALANGLCA
ncbi:LCP family protein [Nocardioides ochotonae]|uniref:LCP family protein n=1 Tax=Nocardioides ochotonae TaxID=2685869 RepID=UPI00140A8BAA|nr:LCP family protein [Nocardioides ochotonae]